MSTMRVRASTGRLSAATRALFLACSLGGCGAMGGGASLPAVLRETEALRHLPRGTRVMLPGTAPDAPAFEIALPEGQWLVSAAYLARIHELLGGPPLGSAYRPALPAWPGPPE